MTSILFIGANSPVKTKSSMGSLAQSAVALGAKLASDVQKADLVICVDYLKREKDVLVAAEKLGKPRILIKQEPPVVFPDHRFHNPGNLFTRVIMRGSPDDEGRFATFQTWDYSNLTNLKRKDRVVAISANKWSAVRGQLYTLRRQLYATDRRIDLFGYGWDKSLVQNFEIMVKETAIAFRNGLIPNFSSAKWMFHSPMLELGSVSDKMKTLSGYKVSLIIENWGGYMSEKLVDSILSGTIPVYVGPDPSIFGIPRDLVIWSEPSSHQIQNAIDLALTKSTQDYIEKAGEWIYKPGVREFWEDSCVSHRLLFDILSNNAGLAT